MDDLITMGVDPGISGAAAFVNDAGDLLDVFDLPLVGESTSARIDAANLSSLIRAIGPSRVIIEQVGARPGQGVSSMFRFGEAVGTVIGIVGALAIPFERVTAARWKKAFRLDAEKESARARALELWPAHAHEFRLKKNHGRAEAALIALFGVTGGDR